MQIGAGDWYEGDVIDDTLILVTSDAPVFVVQYMKGHTTDGFGGPAMLIAPFVESFINNVTFPVVQMTYLRYRESSRQYNIHVTINCSYVSGLIL